MTYNKLDNKSRAKMEHSQITARLFPKFNHPKIKLFLTTCLADKNLKKS